LLIAGNYDFLILPQECAFPGWVDEMSLILQYAGSVQLKDWVRKNRIKSTCWSDLLEAWDSDAASDFEKWFGWCRRRDSTPVLSHRKLRAFLPVSLRIE